MHKVSCHLKFSLSYRSVGVVIYVMLSGVSPFLDESEEETSSNILRNDYCFPEEFFSGISQEAKDLMKLILVDDQRYGTTISFNIFLM